MSNKKQSSIEWLKSKLMIWEKDYEKWVEIPSRELKDLVKQAKAMHKEEIEKAANNGCKGMCYIDSPKDGEQYYNETFEE